MPKKKKTKSKKTPNRPPWRGATPLTLTREIVDALAECVGKGNFRYVARGKMGIPEDRFKKWLSRGRTELRDLQSGKRKALTLKGELVMALDKAENEVHSSIIGDVVDSDNLPLKLDYLYRRHSKLYAKNPNAHDDETGETVPVDPLELLAEKLGQFIK